MADNQEPDNKRERNDELQELHCYFISRLSGKSIFYYYSCRWIYFKKYDKLLVAMQFQTWILSYLDNFHWLPKLFF